MRPMAERLADGPTFHVYQLYKRCTTQNSQMIIMSDTQWCVPVSYFAAKTHNPIRSLVETLRIEPNPTKELIALSIGDPTTFGNFNPPDEAINAVVEATKSGGNNGYAAASGHEAARRAVAKYSSTHELQVADRDVILCSGCSSALDLCISVIAGPNNNILIPRPGFSIYRTLAEGLGVSVRYYNLDPHKNWEVDLHHMERQIDANTACIVINNPSNPCGSVFSRNHLKRLLDIAARNKLPVIADEIYEHLVFPGSAYHPIASLSKDVPILSCSGLTKRFLVPGWRMGWIVIHDRNGAFIEVRDALNRLSQRVMGSNTLVQAALPQIITNTPQHFFTSTIKKLHKSALLVYNSLSKINGLRPVMPQGAMYMMVGINSSRFVDLPTAIVFVERLVAEESVFCLPGDCFQCPSYIRLVLTAPPKLLIEACHRLEAFCLRHATKMPSKDEILLSNEWRDDQDTDRCEISGREP